MTPVPPDRAQPAPVVRLSPKEAKAARERARREVQAAERARMEAERAGKQGGTRAEAPKPAEAEAPAAAAVPERSDKDRQADAAVFLRGVVMPVCAVLALFIGYRLELDRFTEAQAADDARAWVPLLRRYRWLDLACTWVGAPARLLARVRELARKKEPAAAPGKAA